MDSPQALSTVYAVAAEALAVTEPLESLCFEQPVPYIRTNLVTAITDVTGLDVASFFDGDVDEEMVFQACGLVLAEAVGNTVSAVHADVLDVFKQAFEQLIAAYCKLSKQPVAHFLNTISVADAIKLEIANMSYWPHVRRSKQYE
ncbi:MAG: hypothetical protein AAB549_03830 [Patescibacteria group bacterium]